MSPMLGSEPLPVGPDRHARGRHQPSGHIPGQRRSPSSGGTHFQAGLRRPLRRCRRPHVPGVGVTVVGLVGRSYVENQLAREAIVGSADMTPAKIEPAIKQAGLEGVSAPSCSVAGEKVDTGKEAKCFADYMRIHTLAPRRQDLSADAAVRHGRRQDRAPAAKARRLAAEQRGRNMGDRDRAHQRDVHLVLRRERPCSPSSSASPCCSPASASSCA
jgi:hypothetical protein